MSNGMKSRGMVEARYLNEYREYSLLETTYGYHFNVLTV